MAKTPIRITNFSSLMSPDIRSSNGFARIQHFKVFPHKLIQQFSTEASESKSLSIQRFLYAPWLGSGGYALFGLGTVSGHPAVYIKDGGGSHDPISETWGTPSNGDSAGSGSRNSTVFFHYKNYAYFFSSGTALSRYGDLTGSPTLSLTYQSISYTNLAEPVHHPADDCAYFFHDNVVDRLNNTTYTSAVLTLPDNMVITSADAHGDYLAIGCKSKGGVGNSVVYLWDRDSSLSTVTAKYNWGRGDLKHLASLEGVLTGVTDYFTSSSFGHTSGKLVVKQLIGGQPSIVSEFPVTDTSYFTGNKFVSDERLHFAFEMARDGGYIHGIWAVDAQGCVKVEISESETDAITVGLRYQGIFKTGEYWWLAHSNDGSVNRTDDQNAYSATSILETNVFGQNDGNQFFGATIPFEPLPSGASVTLKYRNAGTTSWTAMKTESTLGATKLSVLFDGTQKAPTFSEIQYQITATGGAVITATPERPIEFVHETNSTKPYG